MAEHAVANGPLFQEVASSDFLEFAFGARSYSDQLQAAVAKTGEVCAVKVDVRTLTAPASEDAGGAPFTTQIVFIHHDFRFMGGSLGCAEGEKIVLGFEHAQKHGLPVVLLCQSGGARMQEGTLSLMQLAKVSVAVRAQAAARLPFISLLVDPTYGGVSASYAMQADVRIGVSGARIGFAGPAVILNTMYEMNQGAYDRACPDSFQSAEFLLANGQIDMVVDAAAALKASKDGLGTELERAVCSVLCVLGGGQGTGAPPRAALPPTAPGDGGDGKADHTRSRAIDRYQPWDMVQTLCPHFVELVGDGKQARDHCLRGGLAQLDLGGGAPRCAVVIFTSKGHTPGDMADSNYGMPSPAGYRTALRLMKLAARFGLPVVTFVDTCGAWPSFPAEQAGQSEAIATNLTEMAGLNVPIVTVIVGEGGSGGALGIAMGDRVGMLSRAYYAVISPEGAASILGRYKDDAHKAAQFPKDCEALAQRQHIFAPQLLELGVIDEVLWEGGGGETFESFPGVAAVVSAFRYKRFRAMGRFATLDSAQRGAAVDAAREAVASQPARPRRAGGGADAPPVLKWVAEQTVTGDRSRWAGRAPAGSCNDPPPLAPPPAAAAAADARTAKQVLDSEGPEAMAAWVRAQTKILLTDTTMRDAHQSLLATRVRTRDLLKVAGHAAGVLGNAFSFECWGGATFDVAHRFLHECPWKRLRAIRAACPNVCLQMLFRGSNGLGYASYPDNVVNKLVHLSAEAGMDVFRIFDCFNQLDQMEVAIAAVREAKKVAEVCLCFTGDFTSAEEKIYTLAYWTDLARRVDASGAHMIGIKDMAGLLRPPMAKPLVDAIRSVSSLPIHFHTHNTSSCELATLMQMSAAGADIVDCAVASMADGTSQPSLNAFVASMMGTERDTGIDYLSLEPLDNTWMRIRDMYAPFESGLRGGSARVFEHQIPGGQYSNLYAQCKALGTMDRWEEVLDMYRDCNRLLGDVVKVTPSSKCIGDLALFLIGRNLKASDVVPQASTLSFPESVIDLMKGKLGVPHKGFPAEVRDAILKGETALKERPGKTMPPADLEATRAALEEEWGRSFSEEEAMSATLYPKVFSDYLAFHKENSRAVGALPTPVFWYGMDAGEEFELDGLDEDTRALFAPVDPSGAAPAEGGGGVKVRLVAVGPRQGGGMMRTVRFEVDGKPCIVSVCDKPDDGGDISGPRADASNPCHVASPMLGLVEKIYVEAGASVEKGQMVCTISAMKMEVHVTANVTGTVESLEVAAGDKVAEGSLVGTIKE
eukprot:g2088.t1